jgi:hypothetical protein
MEDSSTFELAVRACTNVPFPSFDTAAIGNTGSGLLGFFCRFVTRDLSTAEDEAYSLRFGRPTFLCSPASQMRLLRVQLSAEFA